MNKYNDKLQEVSDFLAEVITALESIKEELESFNIDEEEES